MDRNINWIYWLAGILDGEGWFGFQSTPHINITQTDLDIVQRVKEIIGDCPPIKVCNAKNSKHKTKYVLTINGNLAIEWMMTIYPIMCVRRQSQIREVINRWKIMTGHLGPGADISRANIAEWNENRKNEKMVRSIMLSRKISKEEAEKIWFNVIGSSHARH